MPTTLDQIYENRKAKVIDIQGGAGIRQRLSQMGIPCYSYLFEYFSVNDPFPFLKEGWEEC